MTNRIEKVARAWNEAMGNKHSDSNWDAFWKQAVAGNYMIYIAAKAALEVIDKEQQEQEKLFVEWLDAQISEATVEASSAIWGPTIKKYMAVKRKLQFTKSKFLSLQEKDK